MKTFEETKKLLEEILGKEVNIVNGKFNLSGADLSGADLSGAYLRDADLSGAKGLISPKKFMQQFEKTKAGYIVYKIFGLCYQPNTSWKIEPNSIIEEEVNYNRTNTCGCGINFSTLEKAQREHETYWKCLLKFEDLILVCVPYNTDNCARCGRLTLLEEIK